MQEYDQIFAEYTANRSQTICVAEVARFLEPIPPGSSILDVGCGDGLPIAKMMRERGYKVHGVDRSPKMIAAFRSNFPQFTAECASILECDLSGFSFAAAIAWGVLFHLSARDQELAIAAIVTSLSNGGRFLFTAGKERGQISSPMYGVTFQYISLGSREYAEILQRHNCHLLDEFIDSEQNYYYIAEKMSQPAA